MEAVAYGHTPVVTCLLDAHACPDTGDKLGETATVKALKAGRLEFVQLLLKYGAQVQHEDKRGVTSLGHAAMYGFTDAMKVGSDVTAAQRHWTHCCDEAMCFQMESAVSAIYYCSLPCCV